MNNCFIYDFETLGQKPWKAPLVCLATLDFNESRFLNTPYEYDELIDACKYIKFDVMDQVKNHGKSIEKSTLDWWEQQGPDAKKLLKPLPTDVSIATLKSWFEDNYNMSSFSKVFTRGNTFDPIFLRFALKEDDVMGDEPYKWWAIRDTRSYIDGMLLGHDDPSNKFIPKEYEDKFIHHDPRHDIVMDVMRMQVLTRAILA